MCCVSVPTAPQRARGSNQGCTFLNSVRCGTRRGANTIEYPYHTNHTLVCPTLPCSVPHTAVHRVLQTMRVKRRSLEPLRTHS